MDVASLPKGAPTTEAESESDDDFFPAIDDEMEVSDFHQFPAVECVKCHEELEVRVLLLTLVSSPAMMLVPFSSTLLKTFLQQTSFSKTTKHNWLGLLSYASPSF